MAAFDPIKSGLPGLDRTLDSIRLGDNVVWQVSSVEDFRFFAAAFAAQAEAENKKIIYIRFAQHPALLGPVLARIHTFDPSAGFEAFTVGVHEVITEEGPEALYVFDCLSELQEAWSTDLMMGNFFRVTCPYLAQLDTVAYFPIIRGMHSFDAVSRIRETTQLFLDVFSSGEELYLTPVKVWNRYSGDMFLPHRYNRSTGDFEPLTDGVSISRYYAVINEAGAHAGQNLDSWDRYFSLMRHRFAQGALPEDECRNMCRIMMTRDERISRMIAEYFTPRDYFLGRDRMIGTGMIGGKACGMLLARKIIERDAPDAYSKFEPHDSFYIGSDVFYTYIVYNDCWKLRIMQRREHSGQAAADSLRERLRSGRFPEDIREQFRRMLDYFGQSPIIVRSSSFLEDGFGNAFAGKYESVFCASGGSMEERLAAFEDAVRTVYASTMDPSALEYRRRRGLLDRDEQMAILVQRVSGSRIGDIFMPTAAGVGYSYNAYRWSRDIDPEAGMLRLVMGLGTRAVNRTEGDYPRIVALNKPLASPVSSARDRRRFSQHNVDYIDISANSLSTARPEDMAEKLPGWHTMLVMSRDSEAEAFLREQGRHTRVLFADCRGFAQNGDFTGLMSRVLKTLQDRYGTPVDIEFTVNAGESGAFVVNLLQCRPLLMSASSNISLPNPPPEHVLFDISDSSMGRSRREKIDIVVYVSPQGYYEYPYKRKYEIARVIGGINRHYSNTGKSLLLLVPGRIGTSSPELGVPVIYAEISMFRGICEVACSDTGYMPELSYGSHMFQDLVESDIYYGAIFENEKTKIYNPGLMTEDKNILPDILPGSAEYGDIIGVYDVSDRGLTLSFDMVRQRAICCFEP